MRVTQPVNNGSWHKQPPVSFFDRMNNTNFLDKLQVVTGDGEALPKSHYYEKYKDLANTYKNFYSIPKRITDIKIVKKEQDNQQKDPLEIQGINLDKKEKIDLNNIDDKKVVQFLPIIKSVEPQKGSMQMIKENKFNIYNGPKADTRGKSIDYYI